jgi:glycosyltransferase involved in cell wall biosynthesis
VALRLRQAVTRLQPDLIHANSIRAGLVATLATSGLGTRVVWHLHDELPRHPLSTAIRLFALTSSRVRALAVSNAVAKNFCGALSPLRKRLVVILNAIELSKFESDHAGRPARRVRLGVENGECVVGIVGQITPRKGQFELLRAFAVVLRDLPNAILVLVGAPLFNRDHEYAELLKATVEKLGIQKSVRMLGPRSDIASIMQSLDLLVINSTVEPFGLVAVEAMACGTPVVATKTGGLVEIIEHEKTGWLIPPRDEKALAAAIVTLTNRPMLRARLAKHAAQSISPRFSCTRYMEELKDFYLSLTSLKTVVGSKESANRSNEEATLASAR